MYVATAEEIEAVNSRECKEVHRESWRGKGREKTVIMFSFQKPRKYIKENKIKKIKNSLENW